MKKRKEVRVVTPVRVILRKLFLEQIILCAINSFPQFTLTTLTLFFVDR